MADLPWIVELVHPPGIFLARQLTEPKTFEELESERFEAAEQLPLYRRPRPPSMSESEYRRLQPDLPLRSRWMLFHLPSAELARGIADALAQALPDPSPPWSMEDLETLTAVYQIILDAFEQREKDKGKE